MTLTIKLFAVARERLGTNLIEVTLGDPATVADLRHALAEQFPSLTDLLPHIRIAINSDYTTPAAVVPPGAEVALIPPVSGG